MTKKLLIFYIILIFYGAGNLIFGQPYSLSDLNQAMMEKNPDILSVQEEVKRARLDYKDSLAGLGPKIDLQISGTYMVNPPVGPLSVNVDDIIDSVQWPAGVKPAKSGQYIKAYDGMENTLYNFGLTIDQPLFTWGKLANAVKLYKKISDVQELRYTSKLEELETELETRLISLGFLYQIQTILDEEKSYADRLVAFSEDGEKNGMLLHEDVVDAKIQAKELDIAREDLGEQIANQLAELEKLTGIEDLDFEQIDFTFDPSSSTDGSLSLNEIFSSDQAARDRLTELALSGNQPSIKMLWHLKDVNDIAKKISQNSMYWNPDIGLELSAGYGGSRLPLVEKNWYRKDSSSVNISVGIKTTLFDGGKKVNDLARSKSNVQSAQIDAEGARSTIKKTLREQFNNADVCTMKIEYQDLKIETADSKIKRQERLFETGYGSEADLLSAKIDRCNQEIEKIQQELSRAVAGLTIRYLTKDW